MKPLSKEDLHWARLDNAAKLYPAARTRSWSNMFRLSATLTEPVDRDILQEALNATVVRFPTIAARLRRGVFWYYLQQVRKAPSVKPEYSAPLTYMDSKELSRCAFRVIPYKNRISVEFFHSLTDGVGGMVYFKTLLAEYLRRKYGASIPYGDDILDCTEAPRPEELEDCFLKYAGPVRVRRQEANSWQYKGTETVNGRLELVCLRMDAQQVKDTAHKYQVSVTEFLGAVLIRAILDLQAQIVPERRRRRPVKIMLPINLRRLFPSRTLRNFSMFAIPEVDPRLGEYDFQELCRIVHLKLATDGTAKHMSRVIATNVSSERSMAVRLIPLPLKNLIMKLVFYAVGERKSFMSLSNMGVVQLPEVMAAYVTRMDMILGEQSTAPHNCGAITYDGKLYMNFVRNIQESTLEYHYFRVLRDLGIPVTAESNGED